MKKLLAVLSIVFAFANAQAAIDGPPPWHRVFAPNQQGTNAPTSGIYLTNAPYNIDNTGATDVYGTLTNAIAAASDGQAIFWPTGTFLLGKVLNWGKAGSVSPSYLQKEVSMIAPGGPTNTYIRFTGLNNTDLQSPFFYAGVTSGSTTTISSGATPGSQQLVVASAAGFATNDIIEILQVNDPAIGWGYSGSASDTTQGILCRITNIVSNTIYIDTPLNETLTNSPSIKKWGMSTYPIYIKGFAIWNSSTNTSAGSSSGIHFWKVRYPVVDNCIITNFQTYGVSFDTCYQPLVQNSIIGDASNPRSSVYALYINSKTTGTKIENNIILAASSGVLQIGGAKYTSVLYNYFARTWPYGYGKDGSWNLVNSLGAAINAHGFGAADLYSEGNECSRIVADPTWGINQRISAFRNLITRRDPNYGLNTVSNNNVGFVVQYTNRYAWAAMNVIGLPEQTGIGWASIDIGLPDGTTVAYGTPTDSIMVASYTGQRNYLYENNTTVSTSGDTYTNAPASLYYTNTPSWWPGALTFPPFDPTYTVKTNWLPAKFRFMGVAISAPPPPPDTWVPILSDCCGLPLTAP